MNTSKDVDKIIPAMLKVKGELTSVSKDAKNPYFKSKYSTLNAHLEVIEPLLKKNELILFQPITIENGITYVESVIYHSSGQFVSSMISLSDHTDVQKRMSEITYCRRYTLSALGAMTSCDDDDGNTASGKADTFKKVEAPKVEVRQGLLTPENSTVINPKAIIEATAKVVNTSIGAPPEVKEKQSFRKNKPVVSTPVDNDDI